MDHYSSISHICQNELYLDSERQAILLADAGRFLNHWEVEANEIIDVGSVSSDHKIKDMAENYLNVGYDDGHGDKVARGKLLWDTIVEERSAIERFPKPSFSRMLAGAKKLFTKLIQNRTNTSAGREHQDRDQNMYESTSDEDDGLPDIDEMMRTPSTRKRPTRDDAMGFTADEATASGATLRSEQHIANPGTTLAFTGGHEPQTPTRSIGERSMARRTSDNISRNPRHSALKRKKAQLGTTTKTSKVEEHRPQGLQPTIDSSFHKQWLSSDQNILSRSEDTQNEPSLAEERGGSRLAVAENLRLDSGLRNPLSSESPILGCPRKRRASAPQPPAWNKTLSGGILNVFNASLGSKEVSKSSTGEVEIRNTENDHFNEPLAKRQRLSNSSSKSRDYDEEDEVQRLHQHPAERPLDDDPTFFSSSLHLEVENDSPDNSNLPDGKPAPIMDVVAADATRSITQPKNAQRNPETPSPTYGRSPTLVPSSYIEKIGLFIGNTVHGDGLEERIEESCPAPGRAEVIEPEQQPLEGGTDHITPAAASRNVLSVEGATRKRYPRVVFFVLQSKNPYEIWHYWKESRSLSRSLEAVFEAVSKYSLLPVTDELEFTLHFSDKVWKFGAIRHEDEEYSDLRNLMIDVAVKYPHLDDQVDSSMRFYVRPV